MHLGRSQVVLQGLLKTAAPCPAIFPSSCPESTTSNALIRIFWYLAQYFWVTNTQLLVDSSLLGSVCQLPTRRMQIERFFTHHITTNHLTPQPPPPRGDTRKRTPLSPHVAVSQFGVVQCSGFLLLWLADHFSFPVEHAVCPGFNNNFFCLLSFLVVLITN